MRLIPSRAFVCQQADILLPAPPSHSHKCNGVCKASMRNMHMLIHLTSVKDGRVVAEVASGVRTNLDLDPAGEAHECVAACGTCSETDESFHA